MLIAFFGFFALSLAPFATPVAASVPADPCAAAMAGPHLHHGQMPSDHNGKPAMANCCPAVGAAALMPAESLADSAISPRLPAIPGTDKRLQGQIGEVATPPPRAV